MKIIIFIVLYFTSYNILAQNIKLEIVDYYKKIDSAEYGTYQFAQASYSFSRATLIFITSKETFIKLTTKIPSLFNKKQEYTDVWVLGIKGFDSKISSKYDSVIIEKFIQDIIKYRNDNELPPYSKERIEKSKIILSKADDICNYLICNRVIR